MVFVGGWLSSERPQFSEFQLLGLNLFPQPPKPLILCCHLVVSVVLLSEELEALLLGHQQLLLGLDLVLLTTSHLLKLANSWGAWWWGCSCYLLGRRGLAAPVGRVVVLLVPIHVGAVVLLMMRVMRGLLLTTDCGRVWLPHGTSNGTIREHVAPPSAVAGAVA